LNDRTLAACGQQEKTMHKLAVTQTTKKNTGLTRRANGLMALEPRFMFDGAAVADAVDAATKTTDATAIDASAHLLQLATKDAQATSSALVAAQAQAERLVADFLNRSDAKEEMFALFNGGQVGQPSEQWSAAFNQLITAFKNGNNPVSVELRSASELQGAKGAFSIEGTAGHATIYLNADWLAGNSAAEMGGADSVSIATVLVEEMGHYLDATLNSGGDTAGDEGEIFSRFVINGTNPQTIAYLNAQNDHITLQLDGQTVQVELASFNFVNAYGMVYDLNNINGIEGNRGETAAEKEQSTHNFDTTGLGATSINDNANSNQFSGNDVSAIGLNIGGATYYGWISRPIKSGGIVRGFYFWTDPQFTTLAMAQADGNQDGDGNANDNKGFLLVVDQSWFNSQIAAQSTTVSLSNSFDGASRGSVIYSTVGSSSDRVDSALNGLLPSNMAPVANSDTTGTTAGSVSAKEQGYNSNTSAVVTAAVAASGNVLTNDTDNADTVADVLVVTKIVSASGTSSAVSASGSTTMTGRYGTLTINASGAYGYTADDTNPTVNALLTGSLNDVFTYTINDGNGGVASANLTVVINGSNDAPVASPDYNSAKESTTVAGSSFVYTGYSATGNVLPNDTDVDTGDTKTVSGLALNGSTTVAAGDVVVNAGSTELVFQGGSGFNSVSTAQKLYVKLSTDAVNDNYRGLYYYNGASYSLVSVSSISGTTTDANIVLTNTPTHYYNAATSSYVAISASYSSLAAFFTSNSQVLFENSSATTENNNGGKEAVVTSSSGTGYTTLAPTAGTVSGTIAVGMTVSGTGVPAGTTVSELTYTSGVLTSIKLSTELASTTGTVFTFSKSGTVAQSIAGAHGSLSLSANGSYTYTPTTDNALLAAGQSAVDVFDYTMVDTAGLTSASKLYITVYGTGTNDPVLTNDTGTATESGVVANNYVHSYSNTSAAGTSVTDNVLSNDKESVAAGSNVIGTGYVAQVGLQGSATAPVAVDTDNSRSTIQSATISGSYGSLQINDNGAYTYTVTNSNAAVQALLPGQSLTETFNYQVKNTLNPVGSSWAKLVITIQGTNDAPVVVNDIATAYAGSLAETGNVLSNDTDVDSGDTKTVIYAQSGSTFTPNIAVASSSTSTSTSPAPLQITGSYGTLTLGADGSWSYAADTNNATVKALLPTGASVTDTFSYQIKDTNGAFAVAELAVTVRGQNDAPTNTYPTSVTSTGGSPVSFTGGNQISVADLDSNLTSVVLHVDHGNLAATVSGSGSVSNSGSSEVTITGTQAEINATLASLVYTPTVGYRGSDYLTIFSKDALNAYDSDGVAILIPSDTTATVSEAGLSAGSNGASTSESASGALTLPVAQTITTAQSGTSSYGSWTVSTAGTFTYTLTSRVTDVNNGTTPETDTFSYTAYDSYGNAITNTVTLTITDDVPQANADIASVVEGATATGNVLTDGADDVFGADGPKVTSPVGGVVGVRAAGGDTTTDVTTGVSTSITGLYGTLTLSANGTYSYVANAVGSTSTDIFVYTIEDADGDRSTTTLTFSVSDAAVSPALQVTDVDVNEGSDYAVFTVTGVAGQAAHLSLSNASGDGGATDAAQGKADLRNAGNLPTIQYLSGSTWTNYDASNPPTLPAGGLKVRVLISAEQDASFDGSETFKLVASNDGGVASTGGTATIYDDGTGSKFTFDGTTGQPSSTSGPGAGFDDDRGITVNGLDDVSEGSNSVFTVTLPDGNTHNTEISLTLSNGTAGSTDYSSSFTAYYYVGTTQTALTITGGKVILPAGVTSFYVNVPTTQDTALEGAENFSLTAAITGGKSASDTSTILDDGTGKSYDDKGLTPTGPGNDDRGITVNGLDDVSEGSNSVFTVTLPDGNTHNTEISLTLSNGTAGSTDYSSSFTAYYYVGTTQTALTITGGKVILPAGVTSFYVNVPTTQDTALEGAENFSLTAAITGGKSASDTSTILDDGTGKSYDDKGLTPTGPGNDDRGITVNGLDDVSEGSNSVFTVTLPDGNTHNTEISLTLSNGTAGSTDYSSSFTAYYYVGTTQTALTITGGKVILPAGVTSFYVNVPTTQDTALEGAENFSLTAAITGGKSASDTSTILDDGTGKSYDDKGLNPTGPGNDDHVAITVTGGRYNENSPRAVFTVNATQGQSLTLDVLDAADTGKAPTGHNEGKPNDSLDTAPIYYSLDGGATWLQYNGTPIIAGAVPVLVAVDIANERDDVYEGEEQFKLVVTSGQTSASAYGTIVDDGTGDIYPSGSPNPDTNASKDDDRPKATPLPTPSPVLTAPPAPLAELAPPVPSAAPPQGFASALTPLAPRMIPAEPPKSMGDVLTNGSGYQIPVNDSAPQGLTINRGVTDQFIQSTDATTKVSLPFDAFIHSNKDAVIKLEAKQANDAALPNWVKFDPATGVFEVTPPQSFKGKLDLKVMARDDDGREAVVIFQMFVGKQTQDRPQSRESFSDKLRMAGKRPITLVRVTDAMPQAPVREAAQIRVRAG
jgi:VCBS repeat-containing protein